jgi:predicted RNA-binding Zn-ribbon protein involved in translation (DUF1610 family)
MDEPYDIGGKKHRIFRHNPEATPQEAKVLFGEFADHACLDHIRLDQRCSAELSSRRMDTHFCGYWEGNNKSKYCRECAKPGEPCHELWRYVCQLASQRYVFTNNHPGKAFGHRYRIESPNGPICYMQMLQGKGSRFQLPIEDFLYVAITGDGRMNATPSGTRQSPFVDLLLELIATDPEGAYTINRVRIDPKDEQECFPQVKKPLRVDETKVGKENDTLDSTPKPIELHDTTISTISTPKKRVILRFLGSVPQIMGTDMKTYGPFRAEDVGSLPILNAEKIVKQGLAAFIEENASRAFIDKTTPNQQIASLLEKKAPTAEQTCPRCGSTLVWRTARKTGERYRGCTNYPACYYNERSY